MFDASKQMYTMYDFGPGGYLAVDNPVPPPSQIVVKGRDGVFVAFTGEKAIARFSLAMVILTDVTEVGPDTLQVIIESLKLAQDQFGSLYQGVEILSEEPNFEKPFLPFD